MEIRILDYKSTPIHKNDSATVIATVSYLFNGNEFKRTFVRDLNSGLSTKDYLTPYHEKSIY